MTTSGWAIKVSYTESPKSRWPRTRLLGKCYFAHSVTEPFAGYETAVFRTRQQAREAARRAGVGYDHATAVRVSVLVQEVS